MVEHQNARLAASDEDYRRFGIERGMCRPSEDAMRTHGGRGTFEWWYTDVTFDEGPTVVLIFFTKNYFDVSGPAWPTVDFELVEKDGTRTNVFTRGKRGVCASGETEACDVVIEKNFIRYEDGSYHLHYEDHGIVYDAVMRPRMGMWRPESGHWLFGEGAEERLFAWLVAAPDAEVSATLTIGGTTRQLRGAGYHDHNWGNAVMNKLLNHWYWGRARIGDYYAICCDLVAEEAYGNKRLPVFMLSKDGMVINDDQNSVSIERSETRLHPKTRKFMDDVLVYSQEVSEGESYRITFARTHDYLYRSLLEVVSPAKRLLGRLVGLNPTYTRIAGTVTVEARKGDEVEMVVSDGLWEQYFMGSNEVATIEGRTYPLNG